MNILFLTTGKLDSVKSHSIYPDLIREFLKNGHEVYAVSASEKRFGKETECLTEDGAHLLKIKIGNLTKCGFIEKGISTLQISGKYRSAIKKYFAGVRFDLILYSTPPITLAGTIRYFKTRYQAKTYLMLKDIFPQNSVDLGILSQTGVKSFLYKYFRRKEKLLYRISDQIGCMSQANVDYLLQHNPTIASDQVEILPNCADIQDITLSEEEKLAIREKYDIPVDKTVFVYGGNLGKPQDIPFVITCLKEAAVHQEAFFLIVGDGTEYRKLEQYVQESHPNNLKLVARLPIDDYDRVLAACDVGLIFLDHRFTIPNFPSRLLGYLQVGLPVFACTDPVSDIGKEIVDGEFGWWCLSDNAKQFSQIIAEICHTDKTDRADMSEKAICFLKNNYDVRLAYQTIVK